MSVSNNSFYMLSLDGKYKALLIEMCLKSSSYATMALREILKNDTSAETQAALSASNCTENALSNAITIEKNESNTNSIKYKEHSTEENPDVKSREESADIKDEIMK